MKAILTLCLLTAGLPSLAAAQLVAAKNAEVAMGHHHLNVSDIELHKKFWVDQLGGVSGKLAQLDFVKFHNVLIFLREQKPSGGTKGTSVNHIGFQVPRVQPLVEKLKAGGFPIVTRTEISGGRAKGDVFYNETQKTSMAFVMGPDEVKVELIENPSLSVPIANHHIHFAGPEVNAMQAWYVEKFGAAAGRRGTFEAADLPGVNLTFSPSEKEIAGTKGRTLDHIGFEVRSLESYCKRLEGMGLHFDRPYEKIPSLGIAIAFFTDPWGTYIELTEGLDKL